MNACSCLRREVALAHSISTALTSRVATWLRLMFGLLILFTLAQAAGAEPAAASAPETADIAPLVIGHRPIHTFRVPLGAFTASERADGARMRILKAFEESGEGWTSVRPQGGGVQVELDGKPLFVVLSGDAAQLTETSVEQMANSASHALQKAWAEARERRDPRATLGAMLRVVLALVALAVVLLAVWRAARWVRDAVTGALLTRAQFLADATLATRITPIFLGTISRSCCWDGCSAFWRSSCVWPTAWTSSRSQGRLAKVFSTPSSTCCWRVWPRSHRHCRACSTDDRNRG